MKWLKAVMATVVIGGVLGFMNCGDSNSTGPSLSDTSIVGLWNVSSMSSHLTMNMGGGFSYTQDTSMTFTGTNTAEFRSDHTFISISNNIDDIYGGGTEGLAKKLAKKSVSESSASLDTVQGNWSLSGNKLSIIFIDLAVDTLISDVSLSGNSMTLSTQINMSVPMGETTITVNGNATIHMVKP